MLMTVCVSFLLEVANYDFQSRRQIMTARGVYDMKILFFSILEIQNIKYNLKIYPQYEI